MEIIISITIAYLLSGIYLFIGELNEPIHTKSEFFRNPTPLRFIEYTLLWPLHQGHNQYQFSHQIIRTIAITTYTTIYQMIMFTFYVFVCIQLSCLIFDNFYLQIATASAIGLCSAFFILPLLKLIFTPINLLFMIPINFIFPLRNKDFIESKQRRESDNKIILDFKKEIKSWPSHQKKIALLILKKTINGDDINDELYDKITINQYEILDIFINKTYYDDY